MADKKLDTCGCCSGVSVETPAHLLNLPGQTAVDYRVGTHASFKETMLARLANSDYPALKAFGTREDADFTIAWLDGVSTVLDVLSFYQERYVNENYLKTSSERISVLEMANLIGYELNPGVAASTYLQFTIQETPGIANVQLDPVTIPVGTRVQSVPGQDEVPQIFETNIEVVARAQWNKVAVKNTSKYQPQKGDKDLYVKGMNQQVEPGDAILIVGQHREDNTGSERWDVRVVSKVEKDTRNDRLHLQWHDGLGSVVPSISPANTDVQLFVFRKKASLFGHNAPDPKLMNIQESVTLADLYSTIASILDSAAAVLDLDPDEDVYTDTDEDIEAVGHIRSAANMAKSASPNKAAIISSLENALAIGGVGLSSSEEDEEIIIDLVNAALEILNDVPDESEPSIYDDLIEGSGPHMEWKNFHINSNQIDLSAPDDDVVVDSWVALVSNDPSTGSNSLPGIVELYRAEKVMNTSRVDYGISGKITRILTDTTENITQFGLRETLALVASEQLQLDERVILFPVFDDEVYFQTLQSDLEPERFVSFKGYRQRVKVRRAITSLNLITDDGLTVSLEEKQSLTITATPEKVVGSSVVKLSPQEFGNLIANKSSTILSLRLITNDNVEGSVTAAASNWTWDKNADTDMPVQEVGQIKELLQNGKGILLESPLENVYQRDSLYMNFNVVTADNGETVAEILGDGDARKKDQRFYLKQAPLTYVSADTPSGAASSLEITVNNLQWTERSSLYQAGAEERVYKIEQHDDGSSSIVFGDGVEGGRLPSGQANIRASYRKYIGSAANVEKEKITTLLQKPLGVQGVTNPVAATGGTDPEILDDARENAPLTVLTLDRAVSVKDYQDFARSFSGVSKAYALWVGYGPHKGIHLTVAGTNGASIPVSSATYKNLQSSLTQYGDPFISISINDFIAAYFVLSFSVKVDEAADEEIVFEELENTLRTQFAFSSRDFGQNVSQDEVIAVIHQHEMVKAVKLTRFQKESQAWLYQVENIIAARLPVSSMTQAPVPAELLSLSSLPIEMELMQ